MLDGLNRALELIEERIADGTGDPVDVDALARVAATSEYHFRRMFSGLAGMPLSEYVRRRRLTLAGAEVLDGRRTLLEIAIRHGYGSGEAFARAFKSVHGTGPGEARRAGAALTAQPRMSFRLVVEGNSSMEYRIVEKDAFRLVGRQARVPLVHEGMNPGIVAFMKGLEKETKERIGALGDAEPGGPLNVSVNLDPASPPDVGRAEGTMLDYWYAAAVAGTGTGTGTGAGAEGDAEFEGLDSMAVPAGTWAVFTASGPVPEAVQYLWRDVFTQWFPSQPYRSRPGPEMLAARTAPKGDSGAEFVDAELWIPVEAAAST